MVKKIINDEGFALVQTILLSVFLLIIVFGITVYALNVSKQVTSVNNISETKDIKTYLLEDATLNMNYKFKNLFSYKNLKKHPLGNGTSENLASLVNQFVDENKTIDGNISLEHPISYKIELGKVSIQKNKPYVSGNDAENQGWDNQISDDTAEKYGINSYLIKLNMNLTIKDEKNNHISHANGNYIYEIQWESKDAGQITSENDIWGNVFFQNNPMGGIEYLNADTVMRKMERIYESERNHPKYLISFPEKDFMNDVLNGNYGNKEQFIADFNDENLIFNKKIQNLSFEGSFLLNNGFSLSGVDSKSKIVTKNLLGLMNTNKESKSPIVSYVKNLAIEARTGLYISLKNSTNRSNSIVIQNDDNQKISTPSLLIDGGVGKNSGIFLTNGCIDVVPTNKEVVDYKRYRSDSNQVPIKDSDWEQFQQGNFVIASSDVYLAPKRDSLFTKPKEISINVANNFMLTNASMETGEGEDSFSYSTPGSKLTLTGKNTHMKVGGYSYIDEAKSTRKKLLGEYTQYDDDGPNYLTGKENSIFLKDNSQLELNYAGIEPFDLRMEKNTVFTMNVLPGVSLFDTTFLKNGFDNHVLSGKIILFPFDINDYNKLTNQTLRDFPHKICNSEDELGDNYKNVENGVVTIVKPKNQSHAESYQYITREFSYMTDVEYSKNKE